MRSECADVAIRAQIDIPERLIDQVQEGIVDLAVLYAPPPRTGVVAELLLDWLVWMRSHCSDVAIRAQVDVADRLVDQVQEGALDLAVVYAPPHRTGIVPELLLEEALVAVTTDREGTQFGGEDYVYVDWGADFRTAYHAAFPEAASPAVSVNHGPLALDYILAVGGSGYFRMEAARPHLQSGRLHLMRDKPKFSYSIYAVYSARADERLMRRVRTGLRSVAAIAANRG
jgi:DNA-binding transcriptional LysR family regulator